MYVAVPEAGQHVHAFGRNDFGIGGHLHRAYGTDGGDALVFDYDYAVRERMAAEAVNQPSTDQRNRARLCRCKYDEKRNARIRQAFMIRSDATWSFAQVRAR